MPYLEPSRPRPEASRRQRARLGGDDAVVDSDDAGFQRLGDPEDAADIPAVEIGGEAELGVVGQCDGFFFGLEAEQRRNRTEGLFVARSCFVAARRSGWSARRKCRPARGACRPVSTRAPVPTASAMCSSTLSTASALISGPWVTPAPRCRCRPSACRRPLSISPRTRRRRRPAPKCGWRKRRSGRCCGTSKPWRPSPPRPDRHRRTR